MPTAGRGSLDLSAHSGPQESGPWAWKFPYYIRVHRLLESPCCVGCLPLFCHSVLSCVTGHLANPTAISVPCGWDGVSLLHTEGSVEANGPGWERPSPKFIVLCL